MNRPLHPAARRSHAPQGLETLTYGFEREGCTVAATSDSKAAPRLLRTTTPQLAVVSLRSPERPGLDVITGIKRGAPVRRDPHRDARRPGRLRQAALAAGANDFVATPALRAGRHQRRPAADCCRTPCRTRATRGRGAGAPVRVPRPLLPDARARGDGPLGDHPLSRGNKRAELRISDGAVMAVHVAGLRGFPALHQLLLWERPRSP